MPHVKTLLMYRRMLKSMMDVFDGDYEMFHRARIEVRQSIESQKDLTSTSEVNELLFQYEESRRILLKSVYQGKLQDDGNYRWKLRADHAMGSSVKDS